MAKKAWAAKFKKYARLAGINEPKMNCNGVRKARAEDVAYAGATIPHMMAMFGWKDEKMASIYIAKADRERLGFDGMNKLVVYDQMQNVADPTRPEDENRIVTFGSNRRKKP
jgi:hypothetical protein